MRRRFLLGSAVAAGLGIGLTGLTVSAYAHSSGWGPGMMYGYGQGVMGPGMMYGHGPAWMGPQMMYGQGPGGYGPGPMGPGMMYGYGSGAAGPCAGPQQAGLDLGVDQVTTNLGRWIETSQNPYIKVGSVTEKDSDTIVAEIVTKDKEALVQRLEIDRHTGFTRPAED